ncbi:hypothetical protein DICA1_D10616 [Diutina catenulata]
MRHHYDSSPERTDELRTPEAIRGNYGRAPPRRAPSPTRTTQPSDKTSWNKIRSADVNPGKGIAERLARYRATSPPRKKGATSPRRTSPLRNSTTATELMNDQPAGGSPPQAASRLNGVELGVQNGRAKKVAQSIAALSPRPVLQPPSVAIRSSPSFQADDSVVSQRSNLLDRCDRAISYGQTLDSSPQMVAKDVQTTLEPPLVSHEGLTDITADSEFDDEEGRPKLPKEPHESTKGGSSRLGRYISSQPKITKPKPRKHFTGESHSSLLKFAVRSHEPVPQRRPQPHKASLGPSRSYVPEPASSSSQAPYHPPASGISEPPTVRPSVLSEHLSSPPKSPEHPPSPRRSFEHPPSPRRSFEHPSSPLKSSEKANSSVQRVFERDLPVAEEAANPFVSSPPKPLEFSPVQVSTRDLNRKPDEVPNLRPDGPSAIPSSPQYRQFSPPRHYNIDKAVDRVLQDPLHSASPPRRPLPKHPHSSPHPHDRTPPPSSPSSIANETIDSPVILPIDEDVDGRDSNREAIEPAELDHAIESMTQGSEIRAVQEEEFAGANESMAVFNRYMEKTKEDRDRPQPKQVKRTRFELNDSPPKRRRMEERPVTQSTPKRKSSSFTEWVLSPVRYFRSPPKVPAQEVPSQKEQPPVEEVSKPNRDDLVPNEDIARALQVLTELLARLQPEQFINNKKLQESLNMSAGQISQFCWFLERRHDFRARSRKARQ